MVRGQILSMQMSKTDKFWDWCQNLWAMNIVLHSTNSHLSNFTLQNQLEASLEPFLHNYVFHEKLNKQTALREWVLAVKEADEKLKDDHKRSHEVFEEENRLLNPKRSALASNSRAGNLLLPSRPPQTTLWQKSVPNSTQPNVPSSKLMTGALNVNNSINPKRAQLVPTVSQQWLATRRSPLPMMP